MKYEIISEVRLLLSAYICFGSLWKTQFAMKICVTLHLADSKLITQMQIEANEIKIQTGRVFSQMKRCHGLDTDPSQRNLSS